MAQQAIKMLLLDDKTITTDLDRAGYRKMGVIVKPAQNFDEVRKIMSEENVDVLVMNLDYKKADALSICKHFKQSSDYSDLPVIITSVQPHAKFRDKIDSARADLFVEQPIPRTYFIEKLKTLLEKTTRSTSRLEVEGFVVLTQEGKEMRTCRLSDISSNGLLVETDAKYSPGTPLHMVVNIHTQKKDFEIDGEVVRNLEENGRQKGLGIKFISMSSDDRKRLDKYLEKLNDQEKRMIYYL